MRSGGNLALIDSRVLVLGVLELESPIIRSGIVDNSKPLIICIRVASCREQVDVTMSNERDLEAEDWI